MSNFVWNEQPSAENAMKLALCGGYLIAHSLKLGDLGTMAASRNLSATALLIIVSVRKFQFQFGNTTKCLTFRVPAHHFVI